MGSGFDYDLYSHRFKICSEEIEALHRPALQPLVLLVRCLVQ